MTTLDLAKEWQSNLSEEIQSYEEWANLSDDQLVAVYLISAGKYEVINLMGPAGSGKTFVVKFCKRILKDQGAEVRVCASTGVAAKNAKGEGTLNRLAALGSSGNILPIGLRDKTRGHRPRKTVVDRAMRAADNFDSRKTNELVIFVDEVSMVSSEDLVCAIQVINRCNPNRVVRFVLTGDFRQLLPVPSSDEAPWTTYTSLAFEPAVFHPVGDDQPTVLTSSLKNTDKRSAISVSLTTNHRQKSSDGWFVKALNKVGEGVGFDDSDVATLKQRIWRRDRSGATEWINMADSQPLPDLGDAIHLYNTNKEVKARNQQVLERARTAGATVRTYVAEITPGSYTLEEIMGEVSPMERELTLAEGLKFMIRVNINETLTNGTIGVIKKLEAKRILLEVGGSEHWVSMIEIPLPVNKHGNPVGTFLQLPGVLAHAMTPWKAQGLTFDEPMVYHVNNWYGSHGLFYVVISRVTKPEHLYVLVEKTPMLNKCIVSEQKVKKFIKDSEIEMYKALGTYTAPKTWSEAGEGKVWVREHQVLEVEYVADPKASHPDINVLSDSDKCTVYQLDDHVGMYVKQRDAVAEMLEDNSVFQWFVDHVQFVWFDPA